MTTQELAQQAADALRERTGGADHDIALVMGSGWLPAADALGDAEHEIPLAELPGFSAPAVAGHGGTVRSVTLGDRRLLIFLGRTHYYEGKGVAAVVHGVRTAAAAGVKTLVLTNGCGGLNPAWAPGTPVLISDHINMTATSPLEGANFVDLTDLYSSRLRALCKEADPEPRRGRLRPAARAALRDPRRDRHGPRDRRRPRGHVDDARGHRGQGGRAWRSSASRWSPTRRPA